MNKGTNIDVISYQTQIIGLFACFGDVSYISGLLDPFSFRIVYASIVTKSAIFCWYLCRKGASSLPI